MNKKDLRKTDKFCGACDVNDEEFADLRALIKESYPTLPNDFTRSVMSKISDERAKKQALARRKLLSGIVKWGSVVACFVIISAAVIKVAPSFMGKSDSTLAPDSNVYMYTADEAFEEAEAYSAPILKSAPNSNTNAEDGAAAIEHDDYTEAPAEADECYHEAETCPEIGAMSDETALNDALIDDTSKGEYVDEDVPALKLENSILTDAMCEHSGVFMNSYHDIPEAFISLVPNESYMEWSVTHSGCEKNIYEFINYFGISKADFERIYEGSDICAHHDYDVDLLYGGDAEAVSEYYKNGGDFAGMVKRYFEYKIRLALVGEVGMEEYLDYRADNGQTAVYQIDNLDFSEHFVISSERLEALIAEVEAEFEEEFPGYSVK